MKPPNQRGFKRTCSIAIILCLLSFTGAQGRPGISLAGPAASSGQPPGPSKTGESANADAVRAAYGRLPMQFQPNFERNLDLRGARTRGSEQFISRGAGYTLTLSSTEVRMSLDAALESDLGLAGTKLRTSSLLGPTSRQSQIRNSASALLSMRLVGANPKAELSGDQELSGKNNYLIGKDPSRWVTDVATYRRVIARRVYRGIDAVYYGSNQQLEYDFIVAPGADPNAITLAFEGAQRMRIDMNGDLVSAPGPYAPRPLAESSSGRWSGRYRLGIGHFAAPEHNRVTRIA